MLEVALVAARTAGDAIARQRDVGETSFAYKGGVELVSSADLESDRVIRTAISATFPSHLVVSEEDGERDTRVWGADSLWVVDPLDGTVNFARGMSHVAVSIAFAVRGEVQVGVVHAPFLGETYTAVRGEGARLNGAPIAPAGHMDLSQMLVAVGFPHNRSNVEGLLRRLRRLVLDCQDVRRLAAPSLDICWVAAGRLDGYHETIRPWDVAAAGLVAAEAGCRRTNLAERPAWLPPELFGEEILISAADSFGPLVELLKRA